MNRKDEHLSLAKVFYKENPNDFDAIRFVHHSLTENRLEDVNLATQLMGYELSFPFYINAMTGGSEKTRQINQQLATIARETDLMIATGSVTSALRDPDLIDSFTIMRETNPSGLILANIGGGIDAPTAKKAVELFDADGLQIHLNVPQELLMPEGDRDFANWKTIISEILLEVDVPVLVKEVGFGMSRETIRELTELGVKTIDVSGTGGTSFAKIENARRKKREFNYLDDWGQSTVISLLEANEADTTAELVASGGVQNAYDIFKSLSLGASAVGISGMILHDLMTNGVEDTIQHIEAIKEQLRILYALTGKRTTKELIQNQLIITGAPKEWAAARKIDLTKYSLR